VIVGPELLRLLSDTTACCAGETAFKGYDLDLEWVAATSVRRWFPGLGAELQREIVAEILESLEHERKRVN
jgi:hypothetical protein